MRNLARLFTSEGPLNWEIARQMAQFGPPREANPKPTPTRSPRPDRRADPSGRVARTEATGLPVSAERPAHGPGGHPERVGPADPGRLETAAREAGRPDDRIVPPLPSRPEGPEPCRVSPGPPARVEAPSEPAEAWASGATTRWASCSATCRKCSGRSCSECRPDRWSVSSAPGPWASTTCPCPARPATSC